MRVDFPDEVLPVKFAVDPERPMSDDEYFNFCMANPSVRFERTAQGEIIIVPPAGYESDRKGVKVITQLDTWATKDGRGEASGSTVAFVLRTGATLSPDAAWVSNRRLAKLSRDQLEKFPPLCPEFVIEVMSPSDRLRAAQEKMQEWMRAGVELGWLIQPNKKTVYVYRAGQSDPKKRSGILSIDGERPVAGFKLDLRKIWAGLPGL
jgi:Uma2 family endonuclease